MLAATSEKSSRRHPGRAWITFQNTRSYDRSVSATTITDDPQHEAALAGFLRLAQESQTTHRARLLELRDATDTCENAQGQALPLPRTVVSLLELEIFKRRMRQRALVQPLDVPAARPSEILHGKRRLNLDFARCLCGCLGIPAEVVLRLRDAA